MDRQDQKNKFSWALHGLEMKSRKLRLLFPLSFSLPQFPHLMFLIMRLAHESTWLFLYCISSNNEFHWQVPSHLKGKKGFAESNKSSKARQHPALSSPWAGCLGIKHLFLAHATVSENLGDTRTTHFKWVSTDRAWQRKGLPSTDKCLE